MILLLFLYALLTGILVIASTTKVEASKDGRCGLPVIPGKKYCTVHQKVKQREDGKEVKCKAVRTNGKRCGMQTANKSGYCYYHD